jgi:hypothetical protein
MPETSYLPQDLHDNTVHTIRQVTAYGRSRQDQRAPTDPSSREFGSTLRHAC